MNAIVTGATKGMGRALVLHLAANNYNVVLCARNEEQINNFIAELSSRYPEQSFYGRATDLSDPAEVKAFAAFALQRTGNPQVLINNAGLFIPASLLEEEEGTLERQMQVNVYAPHYLCKFFAREMMRHGSGHIFNISSVAGLKPFTGSASYSISKAALLSLTRVLREDLMDKGVKVTAVLPGATLTDSWAGTTLPPDRLVDAEDIAKAVISCLGMSDGANVDEILIRPLKGDL